MNSSLDAVTGDLSRPVTPAKQPGGAHETYVVCLDCGKRLAYDMTAMRVGKELRD